MTAQKRPHRFPAAVALAVGSVLLTSGAASALTAPAFDDVTVNVTKPRFEDSTMGRHVRTAKKQADRGSRTAGGRITYR